MVCHRVITASTWIVVRTEAHAADAKKAGVITSYTRTTLLTSEEWREI